MAIPESEIERVKSNVSLAAVIRSRGIELKKKGKQLWGWQAKGETVCIVPQGNRKIKFY